MARARAALPLLLAAALTTVAAQAPDPLEAARSRYAAGDTPGAATAFREAGRALEDAEPQRAAAAYNNACVLFTNLGHFDGALADCRTALELRSRGGDPELLARAHNNLALALQGLLRYADAERHFLEALELQRSAGDVSGRALNLMNLGANATWSGRYALALERLLESEELAAAHADEAWAARRLRRVRINRAVVYERLGAFREALEVYRGLLDEAGDPDRAGEGALRLNLGVVYRNLGDPYRALEEFDRAAAVYAELDDRAALANVVLNRALVLELNLEDGERAEEAYREASRLAGTDRPAEAARVDRYHGEFLLRAGRGHDAERVLRAGLARAESGGASDERLAFLAALGRLAMAREQWDEAARRLDEALAAVREEHAALPSARLRADYLAEQRPVFEAAVRTHAELAGLRPGSAHAALALAQAGQSRRIDEPGQGNVPTAPALTYFVADNVIFRWWEDGRTLRLDRLGPIEPVQSSIEALHLVLARGGEPEPERLQELSGRLLDGVDLGSGSLTIRADVRLRYLPFELLPLPGGGGALLERLELTYLPLGSVAGRRDGVPRVTSYDWLGFGAPQRSTEAGRPTAAALVARRFGRLPLRAVVREFDDAERIVGGRTSRLTGAEATEEAFRRHVAEGARIVHVASHTVLDERLREGAAILLAPGPESDGLLFPWEVAEFDYPVELTVLAACRTALGTGETNDAFGSLAQAFLTAGSEAVLATLWDVGDEATRTFMARFYEELESGLPPAAALAATKRAFHADPHWGPSVWAAYVLVGDAGAGGTRARGAPWLAAVLPIVAGAALWLLLRRLRGGS